MPGSEFFLPGPGRDFKNFIAGAGIFLLPGPRPGWDRIFFYCRAGPRFKFFYCRSRDLFYCRGRAGIKISLMPGPGQNCNIFYCRGRAEIKIFYIAGAGAWAGPGSELFFIAGAGPGLKF